MAHSLATLPSEILNKVLCHCSADDLARARLVSSRFREAASRLLFRKLTFWHTPQSAANVASVIASEDLRPYVREVCFSARKSNNISDLHGYPDSSNALPAQLLHTLQRVSLLDNLTVLRCFHADKANDNLSHGHSVDKFGSYRGEILRTLIAGLAERGATLRKLEKLIIVNFPCRSQPQLTNHPGFSSLLRTLQTLILRFDYKSEASGPYWDFTLGGRLREFFSLLPQAWLAPASTDLTYLGLGASGPWGYLLKVDFRGVHFPRLKSLVMQEFMFSHDWQLEWITSHTSLRTLCLYQCRILTQARWFGEKDNEGYPTSFWVFDTLPRQDYHYAKSWHYYYQHFSSLLGNLRRFKTIRYDELAKRYNIGLYETFDEHGWVRVLPELDRRVEDDEALRQLKATTNRRSGH